MSSPFPQLPQVPTTSPIILPLPVGFFNLPGGGSGQFNTNEQQILATIADSILTINPTTLQQGTPDLFATEQALIGQNTKLSSLVPNFITLNQLLAISGAPANLTSLLSNPEKFLAGLTTTALTDTSAAGLPSQFFAAFGIVGTAIGSSVTSGPNITGSSTGTIVPKSSLPSNGTNVGVGTAALSGGVGGANISNWTFPTQIRPFIDALFGQSPSNPPTNDVFNGLNALYNFYLSNPAGFTNFATMFNAFNQGGLLTGQIQTTGIPYFFPVSSGNSFTNFITSLLTWETQPGTVVAEILLTGPSGNQAVSAPYQIYSFLNNQPASGGFTTAQSGAQTFSRPIINALFGVNPTTSSSTDPFGTLFGLVINGPASWLEKLFPTSTFTGAGNLTPQQVITDFLTSPSSFQSDLLSLMINSSSGFQHAFTFLFTANAPWSGSSTSMNQAVNDFFTSPISLPKDLMNLVNISTFAGISSLLAPAIGLADYLAAMISNFTTFSQNLFTGHNPNINFIGFNDSVQYGNIPVGATAGTSANGWGASTVPGGFALNGQLQGDLGAIVMLSAAGVQDALSAISNVQSSATNFLNINFTGGTVAAGTALKQMLSSAYFGAQAVQILAAIVSQLVAAVINIKNVLNNGGVPTGPLGTGTNFNLSSLVNATL
jgi:hypothetical protein